MAIKILFADDDRMIGITIPKILNMFGYDVVTAIDGNDVLQKLKQDLYSLVILDINMPDLDGFETLTEMRKRNYDIPVIYLTGAGSMDYALKALRLGAYDFITKPIEDLDWFNNRVSRAIQYHSLKTELFSYKHILKEIKSDSSNLSLNSSKKLNIKDLNIEPKEIHNLYVIIEHIFSLARHDFGNALFNNFASQHILNASVTELDKFINYIKIEANENEKMLVIYKSLLKISDEIKKSAIINERSYSKIASLTKVMFGSFNKNDFQSVFISQPYKIIKYFINTNPDIVIRVVGKCYKSLEILYPENILASIILELINNAKRDKPVGLEINIKWVLVANNFICDVQDNGSGILMNNSTQDSVTLENLKVNASGLNIINNIMHGSGGKLIFSNSKKLHGTAVKFMFPVAAYYIKGKSYVTKGPQYY